MRLRDYGALLRLVRPAIPEFMASSLHRGSCRIRSRDWNSSDRRIHGPYASGASLRGSLDVRDWIGPGRRTDVKPKKDPVPGAERRLNARLAFRPQPSRAFPAASAPPRLRRWSATSQVSVIRPHHQSTTLSRLRYSTTGLRPLIPLISSLEFRSANP